MDTYGGAHYAITDAPDNDKIHVLAFSLGSAFDTRAQARDRVESYVIAGPESRLRLYGLQLQGASAVLGFQRVGEPLPEIGEVLSLSTEVARRDHAAAVRRGCKTCRPRTGLSPMTRANSRSR